MRFRRKKLSAADAVFVALATTPPADPPSEGTPCAPPDVEANPHLWGEGMLWTCPEDGLVWELKSTRTWVRWEGP